MIQKKICMVGVFGTGKTSLVQQFVHSRFAERYLSTVGVKIDRKTVDVGGTSLTFMLWDVQGRDEHEDIPASYLRGAHGLIYVCDGTRRETLDQLADLRRIGREAAGDVPVVVALNKADLADRWAVGAVEEANLSATVTLFRTSARTGANVEAMFLSLGRAVLAVPGAPA